MTTNIKNFRNILEKTSDADLLREVIGCAAERLMELEAGAAKDAAYGEQNSGRLAQRNGYRGRDWEKQASPVDLRIPKLRNGSFFPWLPEAPAHCREDADEAYGQGISTHSVDDL